MINIKRIYKLLKLLIHIVFGLLLTLAFSHSNQTQPSPLFDKIACWWRARISRILGVHITVDGPPIDQAALWVVNHISWVDIAVVGGLMPGGFLAKSEVQHWPVVGWLAARSGTLFIRRGASGGAKDAVTQITNHLIAGRRIILFPEGSTTSGNGVRPFHPRLFASAINAGVPIQPIAIRYFSSTQTSGSPKTHPTIPFIDDDTLLSHAWRLLGESHINVELYFLQPLMTHSGIERRALAKAAHKAISQYVVGDHDDNRIIQPSQTE